MELYTQREFERLSDDHQMHAMVHAIDRDFPMKVWAFDGMTKDQQLYQLYKALANLVIPEIPPIPPALGLVNVFHAEDYTTEVFNPADNSNTARGDALVAAVESAQEGDCINILSGQFRIPSQITLPQGVTLAGQGPATQIEYDEGVAMFIMSGGWMANVALAYGGIQVLPDLFCKLSGVSIRTTPDNMAAIVIESGGLVEMRNVILVPHVSQPCISATSVTHINCFSSYARTEPDSNVLLDPPGGLYVDPSVNI